MTQLPRGVWQYAVLLVILFAIASIAAYSTISYLHAKIEEYPEVLEVATFMIWALTMGFMFIAGAFGLWAIQFSAESESRLRVSEIVEAMDYLSDGLLVTDKKGRITGSNPALKALAPSSGISRHTSLREVFPCLIEEDVTLLLDLHGPNEVQRDILDSNGRRTLRFRSQTAGGMRLILVSDVTTMRLRELRRQQIARFDLIGRIVRGAAYDFSNVLSSISGHASLLSRLRPGSAEMKNSLDAITSEAGKGALLAGHLLEFSRLSPTGRPTDNLGEHVKKAGNLIRIGLSPSWKVEINAEEDFPVVPLSGLQVEQAVLNLGLVAADALSRPGVVRVSANRPSHDHLLNVGDEFAAVIIVSAGKSDAGIAEQGEAGLSERTTVEEAGAIQSVVKSVLEEAGGSMDFFTGADGSQIYRIILPYGNIEMDLEEAEELADELLSYIAHWQVLLARPIRARDHVEEKLREIGVRVERIDNVISALARVESGQGLHAIIVEKDLLGDEADGLLKAMIRLCPTTGIVVLCEDPERGSQSLLRDVVFESTQADSGKIIRAMVEAKGLAARRHQAAREDYL